MTGINERARPAVGPPTRQPSAAWTLALTSAGHLHGRVGRPGGDHRVAPIGATSTPASTLQWTINGYGWPGPRHHRGRRVGDLFGRRRIFLTGIATVHAGLGGLCVRPQRGVLIGARAVQGLGAAVILPLSLTILATRSRPTSGAP